MRYTALGASWGLYSKGIGLKGRVAEVGETLEEWWSSLGQEVTGKASRENRVASLCEWVWGSFRNDAGFEGLGFGS